MTVSRLDQLYRRLLLTKFFTRGWGKPDNLKRLFAFRKILSNRETCQHLVPADYPIHIDKEYRDGDCHILEGHFTSPFIHHLPGIMPKEVETASFQMILPLQWRQSNLKPVCIHLAGTGDHYFWRRRIFAAKPLLKEAGLASILLENPYYGTRKPKQQLRSSLQNVSDLFVMGGALVLESLALLHWCEREGWGPLGLSGLSMGGHMASLAATNWTKPLTLVPCLSWSTASCVFTQGVMSGAIPWKTLQDQIFENSVYQDEIRKLIISPEDKRKSYHMGQQFVKDYSQDILHVESIHHHIKQQYPHSTFLDEKTKLMDVKTTVTETSESINLQSLTNQPSQFLNSSDNSGSEIGGSNNRLGTSLGVRDHNTEGVAPSLTPAEYLARASKPHSFKAEEVTVLSAGSGAAENILSAVSSRSSSPVLDSFTSTTAQMALQSQQLSVAQSACSHLEQQSFMPSSCDSSPPIADIHTKQEMTVTNNAQVQKMNHGKIKHSHLSTVNFLTETDNLTLKHAISKSKLTISHPPSSMLSSSEEQMKDLQQEALDFMRGVMDECTHLGNFSVPVDPELIIIVSAKQDAYVPREGVIGLDQLWPGCEVRYVDQGHVGAVLFNQSVFRKAIIDAFEKQIKKYYQTPGSEPCVEHPLKSIS